MTLSERIREAMADAKLTQVELARRVGVAPPSVHGWLTGKAKFLRGENLLLAARALGVNQEWLATGKGNKKLGTDADDQQARAEEQELVEIYRKLSPTNRQVLLGEARIALKMAEALPTAVNQ